VRAFRGSIRTSGAPASRSDGFRIELENSPDALDFTSTVCRLTAPDPGGHHDVAPLDRNGLVGMGAAFLLAGAKDSKNRDCQGDS